MLENSFVTVKHTPSHTDSLVVDVHISNGADGSTVLEVEAALNVALIAVRSARSVKELNDQENAPRFRTLQILMK